ncbi:hypothetical protein CC86DRAFT_412859 [Ophiobolus disseminans]|uniref:Uncharacterized protein n=1 Tax=Ophiobolus disseminans TaxID=1469910 RepID=A0A6A6ZEJ6_9PLEO|nr:hypothetical protein CC86DRAFT_412859 [Ophiobolus disseminans]
MDDEMPPLTSTMEALPIRVERPKKLTSFTAAQPFVLEDGEVDEGRLLAGYSSSPPPLSEDRSGLMDEGEHTLPQAEARSLYNDLELSLYEYAALEERYQTLSGQHRELRKLTSAYDEIIRGTFRYDEDAASIEELRADADCEGLHAYVYLDLKCLDDETDFVLRKASEAELLRPMVREAGSVQALASRTQSVASLIEEAGGIDELKELVTNAQLLRLSLDEVGGLQGLHNLVSQANRQHAEQQKLAELRASVDGPVGFRAKALKYDMLQQAFAAIQREPAAEQPRTGRTTPHTNVSQAQVPRNISNLRTVQTNYAAVANHNTLTPRGAAIMNPARAAMLSAAPRGRDPDRDLIEAPPPLKRPNSTKTGSNDVPLGKRRAGSARYEDELQLGMSKRPRVDVSRASSLVQATLQGTPRNTDPNYGRLKPIDEATPWQTRFDQLLEHPRTLPVDNTSTVAPGVHPQWEGRFRGRLERTPSADSPTVKIEARRRG